jgi:hypothetical protein
MLATRLARAGWDAHWFRAPDPLPPGFVSEERGFRFDARPVPFSDPRPMVSLVPSLAFLPCELTYGLRWADSALDVLGGKPRAGRDRRSQGLAERLRAGAPGRRGRPAAVRFVDAVRYASAFAGVRGPDRAEQVRLFDTILWGGWVDPREGPERLRPARLFYPVGGERRLLSTLRASLARYGGTERDASEIRAVDGIGGLIRLRTRGGGSERFEEVLSHADRAHAFTSFHLPGSHPEAPSGSLDPTDWSSCLVLHLGLTRKPAALAHHTALLEPGLELDRRLWGDSVPQPIGLYVRHPTATDSSNAPPEGAALTITCPLPRTVARALDWRRSGARWKAALISAVVRQAGVEEGAIAVARLNTPADYRSALRSTPVSALPTTRSLAPLLARARRGTGRKEPR